MVADVCINTDKTQSDPQNGEVLQLLTILWDSSSVVSSAHFLPKPRMQGFSVAVAVAFVLVCICINESTALPSNQEEILDTQDNDVEQSGSWSVDLEDHLRQKRASSKCKWCCNCCHRSWCGWCCK
ncbi:hypothetical protein DPEC_G00351000 [Dallia pectoralis]|uniref:Uncharacterized protein n=1 Tax=Dallia pectoralis TaxID=75939 RepID=A0ACC2F281_DALPE|nr:hypothetical protein DPEC_G00351000 [Dallia pectoralis]